MNPIEIPSGARTVACEAIDIINPLNCDIGNECYYDCVELHYEPADKVSEKIHTYAVAYAQQQVEEKTRELHTKLLYAEDAATKGKEGRKLGTAYEECSKELTTLHEVAKELTDYLAHQGITLNTLEDGSFESQITEDDYSKELQIALALYAKITKGK